MHLRETPVRERAFRGTRSQAGPGWWTRWAGLHLVLWYLRPRLPWHPSRSSKKEPGTGQENLVPGPPSCPGGAHSPRGPVPGVSTTQPAAAGQGPPPSRHLGWALAALCSHTTVSLAPPGPDAPSFCCHGPPAPTVSSAQTQSSPGALRMYVSSVV